MRTLSMETVLLLCLGLLIHTAQGAQEQSSPHLNSGPPEFTCPDAIFAFGDSLSDTGELLSVEPDIYSASRPYGMTFPGYPTGRFSDGKLVIDFLAEAFGFPLLDPYFVVRSTVQGSRRGVNYATGGATARNTAITVPLFLQAQVDQAILFQSGIRNGSPATERSLYHIEIGGNDFRYAVQAGTPVETIRAVTGPEAASNLSLAITRLYDSVGARQFLVWNLPFMGCGDDVDCLEKMHAVLGDLNAQRAAVIRQLRLDLPDALIIAADIHSFASEVTANPQEYGFTEAFRACCGPVECGPLSYVCKDPSQYVVWDGVHLTQAFHRVLADAILTGEILEPQLNLRQLCSKAATHLES